MRRSRKAAAPDAPAEVTPSEDERASSSGLRRRRRALWLFGATSALLIVVALAAAQFVRSPAQQVADTAPPSRSVLTAPVEQRVLSDTVVLRGQVGASSSVQVQPASVDAARSVVTSIQVETGGEFDAGTALIEVSGRPVFVLPGELPAYRDLRPGMSGRDVTQLQEALAELGYTVTDEEGQYGAATQDAVQALYDELGYQPQTAGDPSALDAAEDAVREAERRLVEAQDRLEQLEQGSSPTSAPGEPDPLEEARRQVEFAQEDLDAAREDRAEARRTTGPMLPLSEVVYLSTFPARVEQSTAQVGDDVAAGGEEPLLTVSSGELVVRARVDSAERELLSEGMPVEILSELGEITVEGEIRHIGDRSTDEETGARGHELMVAPTDGELGGEFVDASVRLTVETASTDDEVLVVPVSAVFAGADGQVAVRRVGETGQQRIPVRPGVSGDGHVAVTPLDGELAPGDEVVVGGDQR